MTPSYYLQLRTMFSRIDRLAEQAKVTIMPEKRGFTCKWKGRIRGPFATTQELLGFLKGITTEEK